MRSCAASTRRCGTRTGAPSSRRSAATSWRQTTARSDCASPPSTAAMRSTSHGTANTWASRAGASCFASTACATRAFGRTASVSACCFRRSWRARRTCATHRAARSRSASRSASHPAATSRTCSRCAMRPVRSASNCASKATCSTWKTSATGPTPRTRRSARRSRGRSRCRWRLASAFGRRSRSNRAFRLSVGAQRAMSTARRTCAVVERCRRQPAADWSRRCLRCAAVVATGDRASAGTAAQPPAGGARPAQPAWRDVLRVATADAAALGTALDVAVVTDADGSGIDDVWTALRSSAVRVVRFAPFAEAVWVTTPPLVAAARAAGATAAVGGGSRTDFAQLNMRQALIPFGDLDFVTYAINPQVHTFDDMSIVETLAVQAATVESARALAGERPVLVAPITLRPRFNPNATAPEPPPRPGAVPAQADPRQTSRVLRRLDGRQPASAGQRGRVRPDLLRNRGRMRSRGCLGRAVSRVRRPGGGCPARRGRDPRGTPRDPLAVEALALRDGDRLLVVVANLTPEQCQVDVALPSGASHALDLGPYATARFDGA